MNQRGFVSLIIIPILIVILIGGIVGYGYYRNSSGVQQTASPTPVLNKAETAQTPKQQQNSGTPASEIQPNGEPFCKNYGTYEVKKTDLFKEYTVKSGESIREIAKITLNDETKAVEFTEVNPFLSSYEIDDPLPIQTKVLIPNEKYTDKEGGITAYIKARGNISFNKDKPMFGVNAPNSGTGPFIISDNIKGDLNGVVDGDCVSVIFGSHGYDPQKVVFEVQKQ